ncbi:MAG: IS5/IS1182 family transposase, partial [Caldilineaceae bacterium]|nr:IS5/IS1182 family transposase [Caldilineaceae bacterium]
MRSERAFCEEIEYNLFYRWFLDMDLMERSFDPRSSPRTGHGCWRTMRAGPVRRGGVGGRYGGPAVGRALGVGGTLIEAAASLKSFRPK